MSLLTDPLAWHSARVTSILKFRRRGAPLAMTLMLVCGAASRAATAFLRKTPATAFLPPDATAQPQSAARPAAGAP